MDLNRWLLLAAARRPHVLTVTAPGGTAVRLAVEEQLRRRGWPEALTPADADILLVAGAHTQALDDVLEEIWRAMPAPRARTRATHPAEVDAALEVAAAALGDGTRQRELAAAIGQGGHDGDNKMAGMQLPGGLQMADRADDRDGLKLDQLHVSLGPALPDWPSGLVLRVRLQGDVVQDAAIDTVAIGGPGGSLWTEPWCQAAAGDPVSVALAARRRVGAHLDSLGRLLAVAGWAAAATAARRLCGETLAGLPASQLQPRLRRFAIKVARSRTLAWSTRGIGALGRDDALAVGVGGPALRAAGDVTARYRRWCSELVDICALFEDGSPLDPADLEQPRGPVDGPGTGSAALVAVLPGLLAGTELAAARLIVASMDPDLDELSAPAGVHRW